MEVVFKNVITLHSIASVIMGGLETWMLRIQEHQRPVAYQALHGEVRKNRNIRKRVGTFRLADDIK
jgi:NADH:ubiquinone oxidoreductase subunit F (NADH-binding)